jgi:hypothetical protein
VGRAVAAYCCPDRRAWRGRAARLHERPLTVHPCVQRVLAERDGPGNRGPPQFVPLAQRFAQTIHSGRTERDALGMQAVEFGLDQWTDLDSVDPQARDVAVEVDIGEQHPEHPRTGEINLAKHSPGQVLVDELARTHVRHLEHRRRMPGMSGRALSFGTVAEAYERWDGQSNPSVRSTGNRGYRD